MTQLYLNIDTIDTIKEIFDNKKTIYLNQKESRTGASSFYSAYIIKNNELIDLYYILRFTGFKFNKDNKISVKGCGVSHKCLACEAIILNLARAIGLNIDSTQAFNWKNQLL